MPKDIDYSDIPPTDEEFWAQAEIHLPKKKRMITLRLDSEIVEWFRSEGAGYQTKINAVLRTYIEAHPHHL